MVRTWKQVRAGRQENKSDSTGQQEKRARTGEADRKDRIGWSEYDSMNKIAGKGQPGEDNHDRTAETVQQGNTSRTNAGAGKQDSRYRTGK
jgi:hypothetical protein